MELKNEGWEQVPSANGRKCIEHGYNTVDPSDVNITEFDNAPEKKQFRLARGALKSIKNSDSKLNILCNITYQIDWEISKNVFSNLASAYQFFAKGALRYKTNILLGASINGKETIINNDQLLKAAYLNDTNKDICIIGINNTNVNKLKNQWKDKIGQLVVSLLNEEENENTSDEPQKTLSQAIEEIRSSTREESSKIIVSGGNPNAIPSIEKANRPSDYTFIPIYSEFKDCLMAMNCVLYMQYFRLKLQNQSTVFNPEQAMKMILDQGTSFIKPEENTLNSHISKIINKYADNILYMLIPLSVDQPPTNQALRNFLKGSHILEPFNDQIFETTLHHLESQDYIYIVDDTISLTEKGRRRSKEIGFSENQRQTIDETLMFSSIPSTDEST